MVFPLSFHPIIETRLLYSADLKSFFPFFFSFDWCNEFLVVAFTSSFSLSISLCILTVSGPETEPTHPHLTCPYLHTSVMWIRILTDPHYERPPAPGSRRLKNIAENALKKCLKLEKGKIK